MGQAVYSIYTIDYTPHIDIYGFCNDFYKK